MKQTMTVNFCHGGLFDVKEDIFRLVISSCGQVIYCFAVLHFFNSMSFPPGCRFHSMILNVINSQAK